MNIINKIKPSILLLFSALMFIACTVDDEGDELLEEAFLSNGNFESGQDEWIFYPNGGTAEIDNSLSNGKGSNSAKIATNGSSNPGIKQERIGVGVINPGDIIQIDFDHIGSVAGDGGIVNLILFIERAEGESGAPITHIFEPRPILSENWTTYSQSYTIPNNAIVTGGISFLIESVCGGDSGCIVNANIDNVIISINP